MMVYYDLFVELLVVACMCVSMLVLFILCVTLG